MIGVLITQKNTVRPGPMPDFISWNVRCDQSRSRAESRSLDAYSPCHWIHEYTHCVSFPPLGAIALHGVSNEGSS